MVDKGGKMVDGVRSEKLIGMWTLGGGGKVMICGRESFQGGSSNGLCTNRAKSCGSSRCKKVSRALKIDPFHSILLTFATCPVAIFPTIPPRLFGLVAVA